MTSILKTTLVTVGATLLAFGSARADSGKPVLLIGPSHATKGYARHVLEADKIASDIQEEAIAVGDYGKYRAIVFLEQFPAESAVDSALWNSGDNLQRAIDYLNGGGKVFIFGPAFPRRSGAGAKPRNLEMLDRATGFGYYPNLKLINPVQVQPAGEALFGNPPTLDFIAPYTITIGKITTAKVLATVHDDKGVTQPFATFNPIGKGGVYFFGTSPFRLAREAGADTSNVKAYADILRKALNE